MTGSILERDLPKEAWRIDLSEGQSDAKIETGSRAEGKSELYLLISSFFGVA